MTICVSVKVGEGLVLAADSKVMLEGVVQIPGQNVAQKTIIQHFDYANKVTHFKDYPVGMLNWGLASINARSIQSLIMEFEYSYPSIEDNPDYTVSDIAEQLLAFVKGKYDDAFPAPNQPQLGMLVGGYSANKFFPEKYSYEFPTSTGWENLRPDQPNGNPDFGANWFGMSDALQRLILGFDPMALQNLIDRGVDQNLVQAWVDERVGILPLIFDGMPLQDAIDFAEYACQVVIGRFRFGLGAPLCGGEIDIAVVTPNNFRWAQRKQWGIHHE